VVVRDVEPPSLPIRVGVDEFVRQVLLRGVLPQLDAGSSDYPGVGGTWLRLDAEELLEKYPMRLIPRKASQKWTKTDVWKMLLGFRFRYSIP
jgi:hypothetical protein